MSIEKTAASFPNLLSTLESDLAQVVFSIPNAQYSLLSMATASLSRPAPRWRVLEFFLLLFPLAFTGVGFYVLWELRDLIDTQRWWPAVVLAVGIVVMHIVLSIFAPTADQTLLPIVTMLNGMGLLMIERVAHLFTVRQTQLMLVGMGLCLAIALWKDGPRFAERYKYTLILPGILLLTLGLAGSFGGSTPGISVINIAEGLGLQPAELLKLLIILFLAGFLDFHREKFKTFRLNRPFSDRRLFWVYIPLIGMWGISMMLLVLQRDLGAALLFFGIFVMLAYMATQRLDYTLLSLGVFALGAFAAYSIFDYVALRFDVWLDPWAYPDSGGYQLFHALYAVANGGIFGQGLGQGFPDFVPIVHSDFIVVAIAEEFGLAGLLAVIGLFLMLMLKGFQIAMRAPDSFQQLVAGGLTGMLILQTLIIMAGSLKLVPLTGITLPFVSYGGTSLMASYVLLGMLLRISRERINS